MTTHPPDLSAAVELALRAPSVHNTQPWRWRIGRDTVELFADPGRHLVATDPGRRDLVLSCGAALHHLLVALAAAGSSVDVARLPDPEDATHLATVTVGPGPGDAHAAALFRAIDARRTDRRRMSTVAVPVGQVTALVEQARHTGVLLVPVTGDAARLRLTTVLADAAHRQASVPGYAAELQVWTRRYPGGHDGVAAGGIAPAPVGSTMPSPLRPFPRGELGQPHRPIGGDTAIGDPAADAAELLVVATTGDDILDHLRAGEATSAVLLSATLAGLATTPLSGGIEVDATRRTIRDAVLHMPEYPQLVIRVGRPEVGAATLPVTARRDLRSVLAPPRTAPAACRASTGGAGSARRGDRGHRAVTR